MKPNLVIVQPPHFLMASVIEQFCEDLCESHYVYLVRPHASYREDSPAGVRFLNHSLDCLPRFGSVETAIAVADHEIGDRLKECYPDSKLAVWEDVGNAELPEHLASLFRPSVVQGAFGTSDAPDLARAM